MSTGAKAANQSQTQTTAGGNVVGKAPSAKLFQPAKFQGKSGTPDNQSTNRGKGRT
jgi:hypothetical protein